MKHGSYIAILGILFLMFFCGCTRTKEISDTKRVFKVEDYGAVPDGNTDSGPAIRAAIADAIAAGPGSVVVLGSGSYKVGTGTANDDICFPINAANNLIIQGQGAAETELIVSNPRAGAFVPQECNSVFLKDFSIDYDPLPFTQGTIVGTNPTSGYFDLDIDPCFPLLSEPWFAEAEWRWGMIFEPDKPRLKAGAPDHVYADSWSHLHDRVWRLHGGGSNYRHSSSNYRHCVESMDIGDRFMHMARRIPGHTFAIFFHKCRNSGIENVTIYTAPAGAVALVACDSMVIRGLTVRRRPDSARLLSTNADGVHCKRNRKGPLIENCYFEGMADDGTNICTFPSIVTEVISTTSLRVKDAKDKGLDLIRKSNIIQIVNPRSGTILDEVKAIDVQGDVVTLEHPVEGIKSGTDYTNADIIYNLSACGQGYIIRNNHYIGYRRHGILLRSGDGLVEGNLIEEVSGLGIVVINEPDWPEGPIAQGITIRNNTIKDVGYAGGYGDGAILIKGEKLGHDLAEGHVQRQIRIENNKIVNPPCAAIFVGAAHNVWITGNSSQALPGAPSYRKSGAILLANCDGVVIDDFTVNDNRPSTIAAVEIESSVDPGEAGVSISNLQGNKTNVIDHR